MIALAFATAKLVAGTTGNLLVNPGAESGDLTGWTIGGPATAFVDSGTFDPGINPHSGSFDFVGGNGNVDHTSGPYGSLSQMVTLVGNQGITASAIDSGSSSANLSFWEQGLNQGSTSDDAYLQVQFLSASDVILATIDTPQIDSHNLTWENYATSVAIAPGTRYIDYSMEFVRHVGNDLDAFVDDNSLTVTTSAQVVPDSIGFGWSWASLLGLLALSRQFRRDGFKI